MFYETVLFDVSYAVAGRRVFAAFGKPTWSWGGLVVVNLRGGRRRLRWCIECCRLFKAGDEDPASGAGIKVEEYAAPPTHRRDPLPHPADRRPGGLQQEGGGGRKPPGKMGAVSAAHNPAVAIQLDKSLRRANTRRLNA
jgi:hypothetical protein